MKVALSIVWYCVGVLLLVLIAAFVFALIDTEEPEKESVSPTAPSQARTTYTPGINRWEPDSQSGTEYRTPIPTFAPRPTAAPTPGLPRAGKGLGVSLSDIKELFGGMTFEHHPLADGRDRWMATDVSDGMVVEAIGPRGSLEQATLAMPLNNALTLTVVVTVFLETVLPNWENGADWVADHLVEAIDKEVVTRVGRATVKMEVHVVFGSLLLVVRGG